MVSHFYAARVCDVLPQCELAAHLLVPVDGVPAELVADALGLGLCVCVCVCVCVRVIQ